MRLNHPDVLDLYEEARDHYAELDARQERMGVPLKAEGDRSTLERLRDIELRVVCMYNDARRGERITENHLFGLIADAVALEHVQRVAEETRVEIGAPA